jgi:adenine phosphoribosyltransferase
LARGFAVLSRWAMGRDMPVMVRKGRDSMNANSSALTLAGAASLRDLIRDVPDFPKPGIMFKDITPLLADPAGLALAVELMAQPYRGRGVDLVVGAESRGFIFGIAVAKALSVGFVPVRKPGKLPCRTHRLEYGLEYGTDSLEIHADAIRPGQRVLIVDDLLATGGTLAACCGLVQALEGTVIGIVVLIELGELGGRARLGIHEIHSIIRYAGA